MRRTTRIVLILLTILYAILLLPAVGFALLSPFAFDSGPTPAAYTVFWFLVTFPFILIVCTAVAWVMYLLRWHIVSLLVAPLPLVQLLTMFLIDL